VTHTSKPLRELTLEVEVAILAQDALGEGPHWDEASGTLLRVDIDGGRVLAWSPASGEQRTIELDYKPSFVIPRAAGGYAIGAPAAVDLLDAAGQSEQRIELDIDGVEHRTNDAKADAAGRLWVGTYSPTHRVGGDALWRIEPDGRSERAVTGISIGNGLGWSPDGATMYFIDSETKRIDAWSFELESGTLSERRPFAEVPEKCGILDGMTVDDDGGVWLALIFGGAVHRYTPDGELDLIVRMPVSTPSSVAFGGERLHELFVTSSRRFVPAGERAAQPLAGSVLSVQPGVTGPPADAFTG